MSGTQAHALADVRMSGARRAESGQRVASVLRWCGGGCRWAVGALPSDEEDRHGRHGRHHQQFRSVRAFHRLRLFGFSRRWGPAPGLGHRIEFPSPLAILVPELAEAVPPCDPSFPYNTATYETAPE